MLVAAYLGIRTEPILYCVCLFANSATNCKKKKKKVHPIHDLSVKQSEWLMLCQFVLGFFKILLFLYPLSAVLFITVCPAKLYFFGLF